MQLKIADVFDAVVLDQFIFIQNNGIALNNADIQKLGSLGYHGRGDHLAVNVQVRDSWIGNRGKIGASQSVNHGKRKERYSSVGNGLLYDM